MLGRYLGRLHSVGRGANFEHRPRIDDVELFGREPVHFVLTQGFIPAYLESAFRSLTDALLVRIETAFTVAAPYRRLRLHGDWYQNSRTGGEQKNGAAHIHSVQMGKFLRHERAEKRNCSGAMA